MLIVAAISWQASAASALDTAPQFLNHKNSDFRTPLAALQIQLPNDVPEHIYKTLAFELDNIDITAVVSHANSVSSYVPLQPLTWGSHILRLVEYEEDGSISEVGYWEFDVRDSSLFQATNYSIDSNLTATQRVAEKNIGMPEPNALSGNGAALIQGELTNEHWQINANMDLVYNSESERTRNNKEMDLGEYLITARSKSTFLNVGHHSIAQSNLVVDNFYRRGISASMHLDSIKSTATGFVMRTEELTGAQAGLGVTDSGNTISGFSWESQLLRANPERLYLSATYLSGEGSKMAESVGGFQTSQEGESWSLVADSALFNQSLRLRGEYAESVNDFITADENDTDIIDATGRAHSFLATYSPENRNPDKTFFWNAGIEINEVGRLFSSLANPNLPSDIALQRIFLNTNWSSISAQFLAAKETDNVDNVETRPEIETNFYQAALNYNSTAVPDQGSFFEFLGRPTVSLQFSKTEQDQVKSSLTPSSDLEIDSTVGTISAGFYKENRSWTWLSSRSEQEDKRNAANSATTWLHNLSADFRASKRFKLRMNVSSQKTEYSLDNSDFDNLWVGFDLNYLFMENLVAHLTLNQSTIKDDSSSIMQDIVLETAGLDLVWGWIEAKNNRPGFDVNFRGIYKENKDTFAINNDLETYEVSVGITMILPSRSPN